VVELLKQELDVEEQQDGGGNGKGDKQMVGNPDKENPEEDYGTAL
jgi:hypothetical protein